MPYKRNAFLVSKTQKTEKLKRYRWSPTKARCGLPIKSGCWQQQENVHLYHGSGGHWQVFNLVSVCSAAPRPLSCLVRSATWLEVFRTPPIYSGPEDETADSHGDSQWGGLA